MLIFKEQRRYCAPKGKGVLRDHVVFYQVTINHETNAMGLPIVQFQKILVSLNSVLTQCAPYVAPLQQSSYAR